MFNTFKTHVILKLKYFHLIPIRISSIKMINNMIINNKIFLPPFDRKISLNIQ